MATEIATFAAPASGEGVTVACVDTDPVNASLSSLSSMNPERASIFAGKKVGPASAVHMTCRRLRPGVRTVAISLHLNWDIPMPRRRALTGDQLEDLFARHRASQAWHVRCDGAAVPR